MAMNTSVFMHDSDKAALQALKAIPGFTQLLKGFMSIWNERQFQLLNMSSRLRLSEKQMSKYYDMLPPICKKLGIEICILNWTFLPIRIPAETQSLLS